MQGPPVVVAPLRCIALKLAEERGLILNDRIRATAARAQLDKLAINALDVRPRLYWRAATCTCPSRAGNNGSAFFTQLREGLAVLMSARGDALPLAAVVEMVLADVSHRAEAQMVAGMIEDQKMIFALGRAKTPTDRLNEQNTALSRLGVDDTAHVQVDAGGQHADITDYARLARSKASEDGLPVFARGRAVHVLCGDVGFEESLGYMLRMTAINAEAKGRPSLTALKPSLNDVACDNGPIHRLGKLTFVEIARHGADVR